MSGRRKVASPLAVWILGPLGSGKSTLAGQLQHHFDCVLDQDVLLEQELRREGIPLDYHSHTIEQCHRAMELRRLASDATWEWLPVWRAQQQSVLIQSTGDKPNLLSEEVRKGLQFGYVELAVLLTTPAPICLQRNQRRSRVLPLQLVRKSCTTFQTQVANRTFVDIFTDSKIYQHGGDDPAGVIHWIENWSAR